MKEKFEFEGSAQSQCARMPRWRELVPGTLKNIVTSKKKFTLNAIAEVRSTLQTFLIFKYCEFHITTIGTMYNIIFHCEFNLLNVLEE